MAKRTQWAVCQEQNGRQVILEGGFFSKNAAEEAYQGWKADGAAALSVRPQVNGEVK